MNPGTLDRKIQIQRSNAANGRFGAATESWAVWKTRMAKRMKSKGAESTGNARERSEAGVTFRIRYTPGLNARDRLVDTRDGQAYDILDWDGDERHGWMEIYCTRHRTPENANQTAT